MTGGFTACADGEQLSDATFAALEALLQDVCPQVAAAKAEAAAGKDADGEQLPDATLAALEALPQPVCPQIAAAGAEASAGKGAAKGVPAKDVPPAEGSVSGGATKVAVLAARAPPEVSFVGDGMLECGYGSSFARAFTPSEGTAEAAVEGCFGAARCFAAVGCGGFLVEFFWSLSCESVLVRPLQNADELSARGLK